MIKWDENQPHAAFQKRRQHVVRPRAAFQEWMVPHVAKPLDSLADVATSIVDEYYCRMKIGFDKRLHQLWTKPLCRKQIDYAAKDTYGCHEIWKRIVNINKGMLLAEQKKEEQIGTRSMRRKKY